MGKKKPKKPSKQLKIRNKRIEKILEKDCTLENCKSKCCKKFKKCESRRCKKCPCTDLLQLLEKNATLQKVA